MNNRLEINDIIGIEKNKIGICLGLGPSLKPYLNILKTLNDDLNYLFYSVNDFDDLIDIDAKYRIVASSVNTIVNKHRQFNKNNKTKLIYADSVDIINKESAQELLKIDYLPYDQRHFNGKECSVCKSFKCNTNLNPNRLTVQEELQKLTKYNKHYGTGSTVSLHMLAFAILMGCNPIYLFGLDLDYTKGYVNPKFSNFDSFEPYLVDILNDFKIIKESADNINVKIYSTCPDSPINSIFNYKIFKHD